MRYIKKTLNLNCSWGSGGCCEPPAGSWYRLGNDRGGELPTKRSTSALPETPDLLTCRSSQMYKIINRAITTGSKMPLE